MSPDPDRGRPVFVLLTCEHGGRDVPPDHKGRFNDAEAELASHRGYDIGALGVALRMAARLPAPVIFSTVTRLLIDLNRSINQPDAFSEFTRDLPESLRDRIVRTHYTPHRDCVTRAVQAGIGSGHNVLHIGVHSCTDVLRGVERDLDIALLFDATRDREKLFCERWIDAMRAHERGLRYRFNEPYNGADDGLTTTLRRGLDPAAYLGIEIEVRQGMIIEPRAQQATGDLLADALRDVLTAQAS